MKKFRVTSVQSVPLRVGVKLEEFDEDEETESWLFRELAGVFNGVGDFDAPRFFQRSLICCEVLFRTESQLLEIGAWYFGIHQWYLWLWHYIPAKDYSRYFLRGFCRRRLRQ